MDGAHEPTLGAAVEPNPEMPAAIAGAINAVMGRVTGLLKTERNRAAGYRFASIDDFLATVNPLCAKAGLVILQDELDARLVHDGTERITRPWLWATFTFTLAHKSGALYGPLTRSVMVPAAGAQAFGAAQSYALKQFMRSLFQIPTGDREDADFTVPQQLPGRANRGVPKNGNGTRPRNKGTSQKRRITPHMETSGDAVDKANSTSKAPSGRASRSNGVNQDAG